MYDIKGLDYKPDYISSELEYILTEQIDSQCWQETIRRRTQHYGYIYDYKARKINPSMFLGDLPNWLIEIAEQLRKDKFFPDIPDQVIINEYLPGQGIAQHIDCIPCFGDVIVSISLLSPVLMELKNNNQVIPLWLEPKSLLILQNEARSSWSHGIPKRKKDIVDGQVFARRRRISITFRKVVLS